MATWRRCEKSTFYRRGAHGERYDARAKTYDRAYIDPIELILVRTMPYREDQVTVLRWQITSLSRSVFEDLMTDDDQLLFRWSERVVDAIDGEDNRISRGHRNELLADLDVDPHSRDELLDAIESFVNVSPPEATSLLEQKVPRNNEAVKGILFHYGVSPC